MLFQIDSNVPVLFFLVALAAVLISDFFSAREGTSADVLAVAVFEPMVTLEYASGTWATGVVELVGVGVGVGDVVPVPDEVLLVIVPAGVSGVTLSWEVGSGETVNCVCVMGVGVMDEVPDVVVLD
jgi:hypothetical protein